MKRSDVAKSFGEDKFSSLNEAERSAVYGMCLGLPLEWIPRCESDWDEKLFLPSSSSRKEMSRTGLAWFLGRGAPRKDVSEAIKTWQKLERSFEPHALFFLGLCFWYGDSCNREKAVELWTKSSQLGHLEAMYRLGQAHLLGEGCSKKDEHLAAQFFLEGSRQRHMGCRRWVAQLYWDGLGTSEATGICQDYEKALKLFREALEGGEEEAAPYIREGYECGLCQKDGSKVEKVSSLKKNPNVSESNYAIRVPMSTSKTMRSCVKCGKRAVEDGSNKDVCKECEEKTHMLKSSSSPWECRVCFTTIQEVFLASNRDICIACGGPSFWSEVVSSSSAVMAARLKEVGNDFFKRGIYNHATSFYKAAMSLDALVPVYATNLMAALSMDRKFRQCRDLAKSSKHGTSSKVLLLLGRACKELGLFDESRDCFKRTLEMDDSLSGLIQSEMEALQEVEHVAHQMASHMQAHDYKNAASMYMMAPHNVKMNDTLRFAHLDLMFRMGQYADVLKEVDDVLEKLDLLSDYKCYAKFLKAVACMYNRTTPSMDQLLEEVHRCISESSPKSADVSIMKETLGRLTLVAQACKETNELNMLAAANRIQVLDPTFAKCQRYGEVCLQFAEQCLAGGNYQMAEEIGTRSCQWPVLTDRLVAVLEKIANRSVEDNRLEHATHLLTLCVDWSYPPTERILYARACVYQMRGMWREAKADFAKLLEIRPSYFRNVQPEFHPASNNNIAIPTYYRVLGVAVTATMKEIKKAFKKMALATHPDKLDEDDDLETSTKRFREISEAYITLIDPEKRRQYDEQHGL